MQQRYKRIILTTIPRIKITSSNLNTVNEALENERSSKEENELFEEHRYIGKGKGKGKMSNPKPKPSIEDDY